MISKSLDCGTVLDPRSPAEQELRKFSPEIFHYSLRIKFKEKLDCWKSTGATKQKKQVLNEANLRDEGMLSFHFNQEIDPYLWRLDFDDTDGPFIKINKNVPNQKQLFKATKLFWLQLCSLLLKASLIRYIPIMIGHLFP